MVQEPKSRNRRNAPEKVAILREHLLEGRPVSDVCDRHGINPVMFYRWQKEFFEGGHVVFERRGADPAARQAELKIEKLERKLREKDEVLGELMAEYVAVKKTLGDV
ncbi:MAG: transposase [Lentisphaeria bacterium]|jgi:transposase-like protein|nr:transposase [Lentisphaeria bacterium]